MSNLQRQAVGASGLPPQNPLSKTKNGKDQGHKRDYSVITWSRFYDTKEMVNIETSRFCVYRSKKQDDAPVVFFIHGGGHSALSWAMLSSMLPTFVNCECAAMDMRAHGDTVTENPSDMSIETLSRDVGCVIGRLFTSSRKIVLVGHSMGGAVAVHVTYQGLVESLVGLVVIDVVEGSAMEALHSMQSFLRGRPKSFSSMEMGIEWAVRAHQIRNVESARVSMPGQLREVPVTDKATWPEAETGLPDISEKSPPASEAEKPMRPEVSAKTEFVWRINLQETEPYWEGWFRGLSQKFLSCPVMKVLILAGVDRLDKDLSIGQMQGKFQMQVLDKSGHCVHEDRPEKVADILAHFLVRHKFAEPTANFKHVIPAC